ncbi:MAG: hypothetical protein R3E95_04120 [Thiolinea sp.]
MNIEESSFFPLINRTLQDQDWAGLEQHILEAKDPLFGARVVERYQELAEALEEA